MTINIDPNLAQRLNDGMKGDESVELPFPVAYVWALNGQANQKSANNATYFGGWACKKENLTEIMEQTGNPVPNGWEEVSIGARDGSEFEAFVTRHIIAAPIGKRMSWVKDGVRISEFDQGARRHLQILAYMAEVEVVKKDKRTYLPWSPVVLTAKGYQANNLLDSFAQWDRVTATVRREVAPGVPAWCFYAAIGTFGKERKVVNVGKTGKQSPITPVSLYAPDGITPQLMENLFVGNDIAGIMADLQEQAKEWLEAWKATPASRDNRVAAIHDYEDSLDELSLLDDDGAPF